MGYDFELEGVRETVHPTPMDTGCGLLIGGRRHRAVLEAGSAPGEYTLVLDGQRERVWIAIQGDTHFIHLRGRAIRVEALNALDEARREAAPSGGVASLRAPMPGVVVEVVVEPGAQVEPGQLLMTLESMKLQTAIHAPHSAIVAEVCVAAGDAFDQGAVLVRLEVPEEEEAR